MHTDPYPCTCTHIRTHTLTYIYTHIHSHTSVHVHTHIYTHSDTHMHTHIYTPTHEHVRTYCNCRVHHTASMACGVSGACYRKWRHQQGDVPQEVPPAPPSRSDSGLTDVLPEMWIMNYELWIMGGCVFLSIRCTSVQTIWMFEIYIPILCSPTALFLS